MTLQTLNRIEELITESKAGYLHEADADEIIFHVRTLKRKYERPLAPAEDTFKVAGIEYTRPIVNIPAAVRQYESICKP